jgi:hypothetical protein
MSEPETKPTVDYKNLKPGDRTPDGMIFVTTIELSSKKTALLRTDFNRMSHYDAESKAEAEKHLDRRLPTLDELDMIRSAMTKKEIKALGDTFAWSAKRNFDVGAHGMYLVDGYRNWHNRASHAQMCLVRSVDL